MATNTSLRIGSIAIVGVLGTGASLLTHGLLLTNDTGAPPRIHSGSINDGAAGPEESQPQLQTTHDGTGLRSLEPATPSADLQALRTNCRPRSPLVFRGEVEIDEEGAFVAQASFGSEETVRFGEKDVHRIERNDRGERNFVLRNGTRVRFTDELLENEKTPRSLKLKATYKR